MRMLVTVATFNTREPAEAASARLEEAGIATEFDDETNLQQYWFLALEPLANIRLKVDKENLARAEELLQKWDEQEGVLREAIRCPECGSSRVEYPQFTRRFLLPAALALLCRMHLFQAEFYCEECQFTWPPERKKTASS